MTSKVSYFDKHYAKIFSEVLQFYRASVVPNRYQLRGDKWGMLYPNLSRQMRKISMQDAAAGIAVCINGRRTDGNVIAESSWIAYSMI